jgi:hypothetical protein
MEVSVMMAPKTSKSQVAADFCCGWGNLHIGSGKEQNLFFSLILKIYDQVPDIQHGKGSKRRPPQLIESN